MSLNGKRDHFTREDFYSLTKLSPIFSQKKIDQIIEETIEHVSGWAQLAREWEVPNSLVEAINTHLRLDI